MQLKLVKPMEQETEPLKMYKRMFPQARPNIFQMELIEANATDIKAWQRTLEFWAGNDYRPQSIQKMLDYYRQIKEGTVQTFTKEVKRDTIGKSDWKCDVCGKDACFSLHEAERRTA